MKHQISITVDEEILLKLREHMRSGKYRNKSHMFEYAVRKMLEEEKRSEKVEA